MLSRLAPSLTQYIAVRESPCIPHVSGRLGLVILCSLRVSVRPGEFLKIHLVQHLLQRSLRQTDLRILGTLLCHLGMSILIYRD